VTVTAGLALLVYTVVDAVNVGWGSTGTLLRLAGSLSCSQRSSRSSAARATRCCRSRSSACARCAERTSSAC